MVRACATPLRIDQARRESRPAPGQRRNFHLSVTQNAAEAPHGVAALQHSGKDCWDRRLSATNLDRSGLPADEEMTRVDRA
jgi:hypothetical protein